MNQTIKHVDLLDQFRGIAILAVMLIHMVAPMFGVGTLPWAGWFPNFASAPPGYLWFFPLNYGQAGVPIFFIVSGFCIHLSFRLQGRGWGGFFIRRFFRIYPAYFAALIFFTLLIFLKHFGASLLQPEMWVQLFSHAFFIHNILPSTFKGLNGSFWSLAIEVQLYLLYPLLLVLVKKFDWRRTLIGLVVCELLIRGIAGDWVQTDEVVATKTDYIFWLLANSPLAYWFSWTLGAVIADAYLENRPLPFVNFPWKCFLALALGCYFLKPLYPFRFLLFAMTAAIVLSRLLTRDATTMKIPGLPVGFLSHLGLFSYSIYLLHEPLYFLNAFVINWLFPGQKHSPPVAFLLVATTLLVSLPLSYIWYQLFELPGISLGKRILKKRAADSKIEAGLVGSEPLFRISLRRILLFGTIGVAIVCGALWVNLTLAPRDPGENNNLAWSLATNPDPAKRNGPLAVKLAESACQQTGYQQAVMVGTLAAAYAEAGRFDDAVSTAQRACDLAAKNGEKEVQQRNQELMQLYAAHQPFHESAESK